MKGVILAAGKGSRLYPVTHHIPKPLLPLANRPTMAYAFDRLIEMGVDDIAIVVGENEPTMRAFLGDGSAFGVRLTFVRQTAPQGLAHGIGFAREFVGDDSFCLYLGDAIYGTGFAELRQRFEQSGAANLNLVKAVPDPERFGVAEVEGDRIVKLVEKPPVPRSNLAMAGLYFFGPQIWPILPGLQPSARGEYEITDAIQALIDSGETVLAGVHDGAWFDTGTLSSFLETSRFLTAGESLLPPDSELVGSPGEHVVLGAGSRVECDSITNSVVLPGAVVEGAGRIEGSILGGHITSGGDFRGQIVYGDSIV